jgi:hypothetical protein
MFSLIRLLHCSKLVPLLWTKESGHASGPNSKESEGRAAAMGSPGTQNQILAP